MTSKLVKLNSLVKRVEDHKNEGRKVVFTNGCFDILHVGHLQLLKRARETGDLLIVGLNSDSSVKALKGARRPIIPQKERAEMLAALEVTDYIVIFEELTASRVLEVLKPDVYVKGGDYSVNNLPEWPIVENYGGQIKIVPLKEGRSTTAIIDKIKQL